MKIPAEVKQELKSTNMPIPKNMIRQAYIFGSSIQGLEYNDIDIAFMVDPMSPIFQDKLIILQMKIGNVEYHVLPDYPWFKKRLNESSVNMKIRKKCFSDKLSKSSLLHELGFRGFIYKFAGGH